MDNIDDVGELTDIFKVMGASDDTIASILQMKGLSGSIDDVTDSVHEFANSTKGLKGVGLIFDNLHSKITGVFSSIASFVAANPFMGIAMGVGAALAAAIIISDKYLKSYDDLQIQAQESTQAYKDTKSSLESLTSEYDQIQQRIKELSSIETPTLADEAELETLRQQSAELERQIEIKQRLLEINQQEASDSAEKALSALSASVASTYDKNGKQYAEGSKVYDANVIYETDADALMSGLDKIKYYNDQIAKYENKQTAKGISKEKFDSYQEKIDTYKKAIKDIEDDLVPRAENISNNIDMIADKSSDLYKKNYEALQEYLNIDLTPDQKSKKALTSFFNGSYSSNLIKKELLELAKDGKITTEALDQLGLSIEDMGLTGKSGLEDLNQYFQELVNSANQAENAVKGFDGTLESIQTASETENQDSKWNSAADLFKKAKELDQNKKWGTDDFQSMAQFIAPEGTFINVKNADLKATDYKDAWDTYNANFKKYFDVDNPLQSAINAQDKLLSSGLGSMGSDRIIQWSNDFKTSAQAAEAWGISIEAAEIALHNLESYGAEFDGVKFVGEEAKEYETTLKNLKTLKDSMNDGSEKERLGSLIDGFDDAYAQFEGDLANLPEEIKMQVKFEYDLAEIQQKIQELKEQASATQSNEDWAAVTIAQNRERELLEGKTGYTRDSDSGYSNSYETVTTLRSSMKGKSEEDKAAINTEIAAIQELQNAFQVFRLDGGDMDWSNYIQSDKAVQAFKDIQEATGVTRDDLIKLFGLNPADMNFDVNADASDAENKIKGILSNDGQTITMDVEATTEQIQAQINELEKGQTLKFTAEVDGEVKNIEAVRRQDGTISYSAVDNGVQYYLAQTTNEQGVISYTLGEVPTEVPPTDQEVYRQPENTEVSQPAPETTQTVKRKPDNTNILTKLPDVVQNVKRTITEIIVGKKSLYQGTAHSHGTVLTNKAYYSGTVGGMYPIPQLSGRALALGNLQDDSWLKPEWKTKQDEVALTGELGREIVVSGNRWWTVGDNGAEFASIPKGSIVFNAAQSKELLEKGFTNSRGVARVKGTAYGNGMPSLGGSYGASYGKTNTSSGKNSNNNNGGSNDDAEEAFEDVRDWVEKYLKYHARLTEKLTKAIENAVGLTEKQVATNKAIAQVQAEIAANEKALATYKSKADSIGLDSNYKNQVINGSLNIETITDETLRDTIADFEEWHDKILDCEDTIDDLKDSLKDLAQQKFDNVTTEFENQISLIEHEIELINLSIDQMEERGYLVSSKFYEQMIQNETENLNKLKAEYDNLNSTLKDLMDQGLVTKYSDQWYEMTQSINDVSEAIVESNTALIEYQNSIRDLKWDAFDKLQEKVSGITDETDFLIKLMSNEKMFETDTGAITQQGKSVLGMNAVKYNTLMAQADEYAKEIAEIEKQLETDPYNLKLTERYNELLEEQRDTILEAQDAFESAIDVVKDGFDAFLNAMDKAIDKRTEELNAAKDLYDYEKQINEQTKEISQLQKQLSSYQGDNSEEAKATIQQIKVNLEEAKMNLDETEYDKYISDQEQLLNDLRDETEEWINQRMDDRDWLLQQVIDYTNANADDIGNTIREQADSVGYTISDAINSIWSPNGTYTQVVAGYVKDFTSLFTTTNNALADIKRYMAKMVGESDTKAEEQMKEASNPTKAPETPKPETPKQPQQPATPTGDGVPKVGDEAIYATGNYYYSSDGGSPLGNQNRGGRVYITKVNSASWATKPYHISTGNTLGNGDLGWVSLDQLIGYSKGGLVTDTGLAMLHGSKNEPELVLNSQDTKNFIDLKDSLSKVRMKASNGLAVDTTNPFSNLVASNQTMNYLKNLHVLPEGAVVVNDNKQVDVSIGDIQMYGVNDPEQFASQLIEIMQSNKRIEKIVQEMTLGAMLGRNSMSKYRY